MINRRKQISQFDTQHLENRKATFDPQYWQLCDELTINQAVLLILGQDPALGYFAGELPNFEALATAIVSAAENGEIAGTGKYRKVQKPDGSWAMTDETDIHQSKIKMASLKAWLSDRKQHPPLLFPELTDAKDRISPSYLSNDHPRFAPKLRAAIDAWEAMENPTNLQLGKTPKQALKAYLTQNAIRLGLILANGKPNEQAIDEVAKIANWQSEGGAPRTGGVLPSRHRCS